MNIDRISYIHKIINIIADKCNSNNFDLFEYIKELGIIYKNIDREHSNSEEYLIYKKDNNIIIELANVDTENKLMAFAYFILYIILSKDGFDESKQYFFSVYRVFGYRTIKEELEKFCFLLNRQLYYKI